MYNIFQSTPLSKTDNLRGKNLNVLYLIDPKYYIPNDYSIIFYYNYLPTKRPTTRLKNNVSNSLYTYLSDIPYATLK